MHDSIAKLLRVQDVDSQILFMREGMKVRPLELEDDRQKLMRANEAVAAAEEKMKKVRMAADEREVDIKQFDEELVKLKGVLNQTKSNEEYTVIRDQMERKSAQQGEVEEELLAMLTEMDGMQAALDEQRAQRDITQKSFDRKNQEMQELLQGMESQVAELEKQRAERIVGIDPEHLTLYGRVLERHQNYAIVAVEDGVCRGCNMRVTPQNVNLLMLDRLVQCTQCTRFLFLPE